MTNHHIYTLSNSSPIRITPPGVHSGIDITIQSINDNGYVYIGGEGISESSFGYRLSAGHAISFELPAKDQLYVLSSQNGMEISVIEIALEVTD